MRNLIQMLFILPFFLIGMVASYIYNGFMTGWYFMDKVMNPDVWKMYETGYKRGQQND